MWNLLNNDTANFGAPKKKKKKLVSLQKKAKKEKSAMFEQ